MDHLIDKCIDIRVLTETWLKPGDSVISDITPPGLKLHHLPRNSSGGIGVLLRSSFSVTPHDSFKATSFENMLLANKSITIHLVVIYRIPHSKRNGLQPNQFLHEFF